MSWNTTRQLLFALGIFVVIVGAGVGGYFSFFYTAPSCEDRIKNGTEEGVDCGGSCARICVQPNITTVWARSVRVAPGVYHAVALIKNPQTDAVGTVPYTVSLFDRNNILIATREGALRILPGETAPLFEANIVTGERIPVKTFVDIGTGTFTRKNRTASAVRVASFTVDEERGRVVAQLENRSLFPVSDVTVTALVYDTNNVAQYASQTFVERLGIREQKEVVFTWQEPFTVGPVHVDIITRITDGT